MTYKSLMQIAMEAEDSRDRAEEDPAPVETPPPADEPPADEPPVDEPPARRRPVAEPEPDAPPAEPAARRRSDVAPVPLDEPIPEAEPEEDGTLIENAMGDVEADIVRADVDVSADMTDGDEVRATMESMLILSGNIQATIKAKSCTKESIASFRAQTNEKLAVFGQKLPRAAMESHSTDLVEQHRIVMEGLAAAGQAFAQSFVLSHKKIFNAVTDIFRSTEGQLKRYTASFDEAAAEFHEKKANIKGYGVLQLTELWEFFTNESGQSKDLVTDTKKDVAISTYILGEYLPNVLKAQEQLANALGTSVKNMADVKRLISQVERINNPGKMFKQDLIGGKKLFSKMGLVGNTGKNRTPVEFAGASFPKLAELASPSYVSLSGSAMHKANQVVGPMAAKQNGDASRNEIKFSAQDVETLIGLGRKYLENVDSAVKLRPRIEAIEKKIADNLDRLIMSKVSDLSPEDEKNYDRIMMQLAQTTDNFTRCIGSPANAEMSRAMRGAKYCSYAAKRMIHVVK
jgi:hypothetical protein